MRKLITTSVIIMFLGSVILWAGCAGKTPPAPTQPEPEKVVSPEKTPVETEVQVPDWYSSPPEDPNLPQQTSPRICNWQLVQPYRLDEMRFPGNWQ